MQFFPHSAVLVHSPRGQIPFFYQSLCTKHSHNCFRLFSVLRVETQINFPKFHGPDLTSEIVGASCHWHWDMTQATGS